MRRLYSLFEKRGHRYHRISQMAYNKPVAVHVFQNSLLSGALGGSVYPRSLRPVSDSWTDGHRIYRPPVEVLSDEEFLVFKSESTGSEKRLRDVLERKLASAPGTIKPLAKGYRTEAKNVQTS